MTLADNCGHDGRSSLRPGALASNVSFCLGWMCSGGEPGYAFWKPGVPFLTTS